MSRDGTPSLYSPLTPIRLLASLLALLLLAACGRSDASATPTALPPGTRVAQPTPNFSGTEPPRTQGQDEGGDEIQDVDTLTGASPPSLDPVQARLATTVAQRQAAVAVDSENGASPAATPSLALDASGAALTGATSLGILSAGGVLYSTPGSGIVDSLPAGSTLTITGRSADGSWYAVYRDNGVAGWVTVDIVNVYGDADQLAVVSESIGPAIVATLAAESSTSQGLVATPSPAQIQPIETAPGSGPDEATARIAVAGVNLRAGPGTTYPIVGTRTENDRVVLLARNQTGDWVQIEDGNSSGWLYVPLIEIQGSIDQLPVSTDVAAEPSP